MVCDPLWQGPRIRKISAHARTEKTEPFNWILLLQRFQWWERNTCSWLKIAPPKRITFRSIQYLPVTRTIILMKINQGYNYYVFVYSTISQASPLGSCEQCKEREDQEHHMKRFFFNPCLAYKRVELGIMKFRCISVFDTILQHFQIVS